MLGAGASRRRISEILNAAYGEGLLSHDTYVERLERSLGPGLVDRQRLIGDLGPRRARRGTRAERTVGRWRRWFAGALDGVLGGDEDDALVLALDWDGGEELLIGRHHSCDVVVSDPEVSRRHCRVFFRDGRWIVQDLESRNGTHLNGSEVGRSLLRPGDRLRLGRRTIEID